MADNATMREWAKGEGYDVSDRGALPVTVKEAYNAAHPSGNSTTAVADEPDYPDGMTDADFYVGADVPDAPDDFAETTPKAAPRSRAKPSTAGGGGSWWQRKGKGKPAGKARAKAKPRVPVDEVIGGAWRILAKIAAPLPPLQRTLRIQAPVAGAILEEPIKGTVVDTFLQPLAQLQRQGKAMFALAGPPMIVTALTLHIQRAMVEGTEPNPLFLSFGREALRESLMVWMDVAGPAFEKSLAKERDFEEKYGQSVDDMIDFLMSAPVNPADDQAVAAEEEAIKRAQGIL